LRPKWPGPARWIDLSLRTLQILGRSRPDVLFVQNPSLALTVLAVAIRPFFGYRLIVDAHNEGVRPFDRPYALIRLLSRRLLKSANMTIVTNDALAADVSEAGGRALVLPDRLPSLPDPGKATGAEEPADVVVIATFRRDEPIAAIMAAAAALPDVRFAVTGPAARYRGPPDSVPANVGLTGFLPDTAFWQLLARAGIVCDLTLKPDCLVCGAYEALAVARPMVLSDNPPTRDLFDSVAVLTGSEADEIASAIRNAIADRERLAANALKLRNDYPRRWQARADFVLKAIEDQIGPARRPAE
jgi:glycosyltransferase involved in cell wall biosynthesis